jgi:CDP-diglyceride synthetase
VVGGVLGAIVGLVVGIHAYLPTSPFAAVEGASFGCVSGVVLALLLLAVAVLPRLRTHR